jgi:hypothetical protein
MEDEMKRSALLLAACLTSPAAGAATIQYRLTGTVYEVGGPAQSEFSVGEAVTASFSVDDTGQGVPAPDVEFYDAFDLTLTIGDYSLTGTAGEVWVGNDFGGRNDIFQVAFNQSSLSGPSVSGFPPEHFGLQMIFDASLFDSVELPLDLPLEQARINTHLRFNVDDSNGVRFRIDSFEVVPEPATGLLALCGLVGLGWLGRRAS